MIIPLLTHSTVRIRVKRSDFRKNSNVYVFLVFAKISDEKIHLSVNFSGFISIKDKKCINDGCSIRIIIQRLVYVIRCSLDGREGKTENDRQSKIT